MSSQQRGGKPPASHHHHHHLHTQASAGSVDVLSYWSRSLCGVMSGGGESQAADKHAMKACGRADALKSIRIRVHLTDAFITSDLGSFSEVP